MTGTHTGHSAVRNNLQRAPGDEGQVPMPQGTVTTAKLLKQARSTFEKQWSTTGRWLLLALPQSESQPQSAPQPEAQAESKYR